MINVSSKEGYGIKETRCALYKALLENEPRDLKGNEELLLAMKLGHNLSLFDKVIRKNRNKRKKNM